MNPNNEKRTNPVTVRFEDSMMLKLTRLSHAADRELADFIHHKISEMINGLASTLPQCPETDHQSNRH